MKRLAIFWLTCAVVGFLAAVGAACVLSLAVDGPGSWRPAQRPAARQAPAEPANAASSGARPIVAPALNDADR